jgi:hypothetical protein
VTRGPFRTLLFHHVAEWIAATDRLVACRQCGKPCLALKKRRYCGPDCLQAWHDGINVEEWRAAQAKKAATTRRTHGRRSR